MRRTGRARRGAAAPTGTGSRRLPQVGQRPCRARAASASGRASRRTSPARPPPRSPSRGPAAPRAAPAGGSAWRTAARRRRRRPTARHAAGRHRTPSGVGSAGEWPCVVFTLVPRAAASRGLHAAGAPRVAAMATDADCLFCKIVAGDIPADVVHETETTVAFRDIEPQAPTHVLVVPRSHQPNAAALGRRRARRARRPGRPRRRRSPTRRASTRATGWSSTPAPAAHQTVFHAHLHVLGGRPMGWPPG